MKTLHLGMRVADLDRSLAFYTAVGYEVVGSVPDAGIGHLTMLKLPGDDVVSIELVHDPSETLPSDGSRLSHLVIQAESVASTVTGLAALGIDAEAPVSPNGSDDFLTTWIVDPDRTRIEMVQWPPGHADGLTAADWAQ